MPRDRKAILERKQREKRESFIKEYKEVLKNEGIEKYNAYGFYDPTPYEAVKGIIYKEIRRKEQLRIVSKDK